MEPIAKRTRRRIREKEERENQRSWADLDTDVLLIIYHKLGIKHLILGSAPLCCSSWYKASKEPCLWREINMNGFFSSWIKDEVQSRKFIEFVVDRSSGSVTSMDFSLMADEDDLLYVSERCPGLKHFSLRSRPKQMDVEKIFMAISKLSQLESMSIDKDIYWSTILIIFKSARKFFHPNRECKLSVIDEELYRGKILQLFKYAWKLIYKNCERKSSLCERKRSLHERKRSLRERKGLIRELKDSIHEFEGSIHELDSEIQEIEGLIREFDGLIQEYEDLIREFDGLIQEYEDLIHEFDGFLICEFEGLVQTNIR